MANPTNVNVPPAKGADPTNINVPVHGTKFPSGATGADSVVTLSQGTDQGNGVTNRILDSWIAPYDGYFRKGNYQTDTVTATATFDIYNLTTTTNIVTAVTATAQTAAALTLVAAAQTFSEGDEIQFRATTSGGSGALKGAVVHLMYTPLAGTATSPL